MEAVLRDVRFALRMFARAPAVTVLSLLTLALGIGGNTAVFSVVRTVLLTPLAAPDAGRLLAIEGHAPGVGYPDMGLTHGELAELEAGKAGLLRDLGGYMTWSPTLTGGEAERLRGVLATAGFFTALGVRPALGRTLALDDERPGAAEVVLIADSLWRRRFGSDHGVLGRTLTLNGKPNTVVGVLPASYEDPTDLQSGQHAEIWRALTPDPGAPPFGSHSIDTLARLAPGVSEQAANAWVLAQGARIAKAHADYFPANVHYSLTARPLQEKLLGEVREALLVLLGAVALVLLIACANVANLLLARAAERQRELAVRAALGAGRAQLIRQLLTESALLSLAGGALGVLVAHWGIAAMLALAPAGLPRAASIGLDLPILAFTAALALGTGLLFGLAPALQLRESELHASLGAGAVGTYGRHGRLARVLVAAEMVLALTVLITAGLLLRSFWALTHQPTGYRAGSVLTLSLPLPAARYPEGARVVETYESLLVRLRSLPGVELAEVVSPLPMTGSPNDVPYLVKGRPYDPAKLAIADLKLVSAGYFDLMGVPLLRGRLLAATDTAEAPLVVVISEALARTAFPSEEPLGQQLELLTSTKPSGIYARVVGVVADARNALASELRPEVYLPHPQALRAFKWSMRWMSLAIRSAGPPASSLTASVLREIRALDADLAPAEVRTFDEALSRQAAQPRFNLALLACFALVALLLGAVGIYGVLSTWVAQRRRELGVRRALGAARGAVLRLVLLQGLWPVLVGLAIGLCTSAALTRLLSSLLFGVAPLDLPTFLAVPALLLLTALLAALLPAWRATRVDPLEALRG